MYRLYKEQGGKISNTNFNRALRHWGTWAGDELLEGNKVTLPMIGNVQIRSSEVAHLDNRPSAKHKANINWQQTKKLWKLRPELDKKQFILHLNEHTSGRFYYTKLLLTKTIKYALNISLDVKLSKTIKRKLKERIKDGKQY